MQKALHITIIIPVADNSKNLFHKNLISIQLILKNLYIIKLFKICEYYENGMGLVETGAMDKNICSNS